MNSKDEKKYEDPFRFPWTVRKVYNWAGGTEFMIELDGVDGCVSFGDTIREAKKGIKEALYLWVKKYGEALLPESESGAQIITLEHPMDEMEFNYINDALTKIR